MTRRILPNTPVNELASVKDRLYAVERRLGQEQPIVSRPPSGGGGAASMFLGSFSAFGNSSATSGWGQFNNATLMGPGFSLHRGSGFDNVVFATPGTYRAWLPHVNVGGNVGASLSATIGWVSGATDMLSDMRTARTFTVAGDGSLAPMVGFTTSTLLFPAAAGVQFRWTRSSPTASVFIEGWLAVERIDVDPADVSAL